jgi:hypothetical protein
MSSGTPSLPHVIASLPTLYVEMVDDAAQLCGI